MGHRVPNHDSKCRNCHGHRYIAEITLKGGLVEEQNTDEGMVMDFSHIKGIAQTWIDTTLDHGYMGCDMLDGELLAFLETRGHKVARVPFIPTAENIAKYLYYQLLPKFVDKYGTGLQLTRIKLWETPNCSATYEGK